VFDLIVSILSPVKANYIVLADPVGGFHVAGSGRQEEASVVRGRLTVKREAGDG